MAQKWYQKASVQVAIVSGIFLIAAAMIAGILGLYQGIFSNPEKKTGLISNSDKKMGTSDSTSIHDTQKVESDVSKQKPDKISSPEKKTAITSNSEKEMGTKDDLSIHNVQPSESDTLDDLMKRQSVVHPIFWTQN